MLSLISRRENWDRDWSSHTKNRLCRKINKQHMLLETQLVYHGDMEIISSAEFKCICAIQNIYNALHTPCEKRYWLWPGGKESTCNEEVGDVGSIPKSGRSAGEGNGNPLQHSCLENLMGRGAWRAAVHGVTKSRTALSDRCCCC